MKELFLIPVLLAVFVFGYYVMAKLDYFMEESQHFIANENRVGQGKVRIAAENPMLLDAVAPALERCSDADPHLAFFLSSGRADRILEKLLKEQVDIILLDDADDVRTDGACASLRIPRGKGGSTVTVLGLPVEPAEEETFLRVMWKKGISSKDRDRVIFALENAELGSAVKQKA